MKKAIVILLTATLVLGLAACGQEAAHGYDGTMTQLIEAIYEKQPVELALSEPTPIDTTDPDFLRMFLGLSDGSQVAEAVYSEAMISSQAYSLCAVRAAEGADAQALAREILDGVDPSKWICVTADNVRIGVYGDVIVLAMVSSSLSATLADDLIAAFTQVVGGSLDLTLQK